MTSYAIKELYGGAITARLPSDFIDASNLRQVPDHQEVFLSPKTLTTIIFEINQYVEAQHAALLTGSNTSLDPVNPGDAGTDQAKTAALFHIRDLVDAKDTLTITSTPQTEAMQSPTLQDVQAVVIRGTVTASEPEPRPRSVLPEAFQTVPEARETTTTIILLLVRLETQQTDFCVAVNVPWKELQGEGAGLQEEEALADAVVENLVKSLEIKDFGLFGE